MNNPTVGDYVVIQSAFQFDTGVIVSIDGTALVLHSDDPGRGVVTFTKNAAGVWQADF